jgi:hypothetical protein|tara:strand:- start:14 stop:253 length:240 start_codon:yes stop_codon:yes gene_type:complete
MSKPNAGLDVEQILRDYLKYCYEETPEQMLVLNDGVEKSVADWCDHFGGKPEGQTNFDFLSTLKKIRASFTPNRKGEES